MADEDVTRRTMLAAERTWLAWWRTALGASVAALAVGRLAPELTGGTAWPWIAVGCGYAVLAMAMFFAGAVRQRHVDEALAAGTFTQLDRRLANSMTGAGALLAFATLVLILIEP
jgi:putative membrane protein